MKYLVVNVEYFFWVVIYEYFFERGKKKQSYGSNIIERLRNIAPFFSQSKRFNSPLLWLTLTYFKWLKIFYYLYYASFWVSFPLCFSVCMRKEIPIRKDRSGIHEKISPLSAKLFEFIIERFLKSNKISAMFVDLFVRLFVHWIILQSFSNCLLLIALHLHVRKCTITDLNARRASKFACFIWYQSSGCSLNYPTDNQVTAPRLALPRTIFLSRTILEVLSVFDMTMDFLVCLWFSSLVFFVQFWLDTSAFHMIAVSYPEKKVV